MKVALWNWEIDLHWPRKPPAEVFVRFGMWEQSRPQSRNWSGGGSFGAEDGLSVYPATLDADFTVRISDDFDVCPLVAGRLAFPVTGRVVGTGSDGEPLLKSVRCLPYPLDVSTKQRIVEG